MNLDDLRIMLIQELGMQASILGDAVVTYWNVKKDVKKELLFYIDEETNLVYVTIRFDEITSENQHFMKQLLINNLNLSFVKFGLDKGGHVLALVEIPIATCTAPYLKRATLAIYRAAGKYHEIIASNGE